MTQTWGGWGGFERVWRGPLEQRWKGGGESSILNKELEWEGSQTLFLERVRRKRTIYRWLVGKCGFRRRVWAGCLRIKDNTDFTMDFILTAGSPARSSGFLVNFWKEEQSRRVDGGGSMRLFQFSNILFRVKVPGFRSGTVCVCVCVVPPWREMGLGQWERERPPGAEWQDLIWSSGRALLSLFRSKSRHSAICYWVPSLLHGVRFGSCSLCKQEMVAALCAFHGDKVSGAEPQSNSCAAPPHTHPDGGVLGWSLEDGEDWGAGTKRELQGWSWSS